MKYNNYARCTECKQIIVSKTRYDFVTCKCGSISIDGGNDYCRMIVVKNTFDPTVTYEEMLESLKEDKKKE